MWRPYRIIVVVDNEVEAHESGDCSVSENDIGAATSPRDSVETPRRKGSDF
jgi:hypothetical protein